jgi:hypothetical protein
MTAEAFDLIMRGALERNFTVYPSICFETRERVQLCNVEFNRTISDYSLPAQPDGSPANKTISQLLMREDAKCRSGISGLESDFAFQKCILGMPCSQLHVCFVTQLKAASSVDAILIQSANAALDKHSVALLNDLPWKDPLFKDYMTGDGSNNPTSDASRVLGGTFEGGLLSVLLMFLWKVIVAEIWPLILPRMTAGIVGAFSSGLVALEAAVPFFWTFIGGALIVVGLFGAIGYQIWTLIKIFTDGGTKELVMDRWDPYVGELEPKCAWAVYMEKKCHGSNALANNYWSVCDHGGEVYVDRECSSREWKFFYQQYCPIRRCRHLCLKSNFDCGSKSKFVLSHSTKHY